MERGPKPMKEITISNINFNCKARYENGAYTLSMIAPPFSLELKVIDISETDIEILMSAIVNRLADSYTIIPADSKLGVNSYIMGDIEIQLLDSQTLNDLQGEPIIRFGLCKIIVEGSAFNFQYQIMNREISLLKDMAV